MACGEVIDATELYLTVCWTSIQLPCGIRLCQTTVMIPYPCGIRWCHGWLGIPYPCGVRWCQSPYTFSYPCLRWCDLSIPYPCLQRRKVKRYCYDFQSIGATCYVLYEDVYGCCDGQEYNWGAACFFATVGDSGVNPGTVDSSASNFRKCFDEPLAPIGPCRRGKSLPAVGYLPGGPIDPGSVSPQPPTGSGFVGLSQSHWSARLGRCSRCTVMSLVLAGLGWLSFLVLPLDSFPFPFLSTSAFGTLAIALTLLAVGHAIGFLMRFRNTV